jgi:hypothetical protein
LPAAVDRKRALVQEHHSQLSICRQYELLGLDRSTYYLSPAVAPEEDLCLMWLIDQQFTMTPF